MPFCYSRLSVPFGQIADSISRQVTVRETSDSPLVAVNDRTTLRFLSISGNSGAFKWVTDLCVDQQPSKE
jgi:hypothetical protein